MQNAADAAALAAASQLLDPSILAGTPSQDTAINTAMTSVRAQAKAFALTNPCFKSALALDGNTSNATGGDIVCGYMANPYDRSQAIAPTDPAVGPAPNCVQVRIHHDGIRNGSLSLFFAKVLGTSSADLQATATASYQANISGFKISAPGYTNVKLLPFTLDINVWNAVVWARAPTVSHEPARASNGSDGFTSVSSTAFQRQQQRQWQRFCLPETLAR